MLHTILVVLFHPMALVALAGGAALVTLALALRRRANKRAALREIRRKEARRIVQKLRLAPRQAKREDRQLANLYAKQLREITELYGFALHDVGISQTDVDRILYLIKEEELPASPNAPRGSPLGRISMASRLAAVERPPIVLPVQEPANFGVTFTEEDLTGKKTVENGAAIELTLDLPEEPAPPAPEPSDAIAMLRSTDQSVLDSFIDDRISAIQATDEEN